MPDRNSQIHLLLHGQEVPPPERIPLRAGPVSLRYEGGDLRYLRVGGKEVLRRIYGAVRDENWRTVPMELREVERDIRPDSFRIAYDARHRQGAVDFAWRCVLQGSPDGTVTVGFDGRALASFLKNRIGLCVLHPVRECSGRPCTVRHPDGSAEESRFPERISPHQPFFEVAALTHEAMPGLRAEVSFAGEVFETEDQRNWTDASNKTYSIPLSVPYPALIEAGTRIHQTVTFTLRGPIPEEPPPARECILAVGESSVGRFPGIGVRLPFPPVELTDFERDSLRSLHLTHLWADVEGADPESLRQTAAASATLGVPLRVCLRLSEFLAESQLRAVRALYDEIEPAAADWVVFPSSGPVVALARAILPKGSRIGGGSDRDFTELNRNRPAPGLLDFLCYGIHPQVHAFDDTSIMETAETHGETLRTAHTFATGAPVSPGPIRLAPGRPDPRLDSLLAAAWTVGSLQQLAENGAESATYFEAAGTNGILRDGRIVPLYPVLAQAASWKGAETLPVSVSDPLAFAAAAVRQEGRLRLLIANLSPDEKQAALRLPGKVSAKEYRLSAENALRIMREPQSFRQNPRTVDGEAMELSLSPYGVALLEEDHA
ncbi:MAG: hypothetical protein IT210_14640 [Armatimonadetes bacterium]|nr:hypothetical protein [Armatimonadota bacterium]